jgi:hypothetical protein
METHSEEGDGVPVVDIFFERDPAQGNVYHAAGNAQEQQREQIHGRDADFAERPRKKTKLDEPESHQKQKYKYEHKKSEKRREKHLTILSVLLFICAGRNKRSEFAPEILQFFYGRSPYTVVLFRTIGGSAFVEADGARDFGCPCIDPELEEFLVEFLWKVLLKDLLK